MKIRPRRPFGIAVLIQPKIIVLKTSAGQRVFATVGDGVNHLLAFAGVGAAFVFGPLGDSTVWARVMTSALGPGQSLCLRVEIPVPRTPGRYELSISLVQEWITWFDEVDPASGYRTGIEVLETHSPTEPRASASGN